MKLSTHSFMFEGHMHVIDFWDMSCEETRKVSVDVTVDGKTRPVPCTSYGTSLRLVQLWIIAGMPDEFWQTIPDGSTAMRAFDTQAIHVWVESRIRTLQEAANTVLDCSWWAKKKVEAMIEALESVEPSYYDPSEFIAKAEQLANKRKESK